MAIQDGAYIVITLLVGLIGAFGAWKIKLPAAMMTGSMIAVLVFGFLTGYAKFPTDIKPIIQMIAGAAIGVTIDKETLKGLKKIIIPVVVYVLAIIIIPLLAAIVMMLVTPLLPTTSLLASAPGGVVDMSILSYDFNANTMQVTTLQMIRLVMALAIFPLITQRIICRFDRSFKSDSIDNEVAISKNSGSLKNAVLTLLTAAAGGTVGYILGIPAGALSCSVLAVAMLQIKSQRAYLPPKIRKGAQVFAGTIIGAGMTIEDLQSLSQLFVPFMIVLVEYLILNYVIGMLIARKFHIDLTTILLACTPSGVSDMALVAGDMGGNSAQVAIFQISRLISVLIFTPLLANLFSNWNL